MGAWTVALLAFGAIFCGAFGAVLLARRAPEDFLSDDTRYTLKVTVGLIAAVTSLILGLMTTSMRYSYDEAGDDVEKYAVAIVQGDLELRGLGAGACAARAMLGEYVRLILVETWGADVAGQGPRFETTSSNQLLRMSEAVRALATADADQATSRAEALATFKALLTHRWKLSGDATSRIPDIFILAVIGWLTLIFFSFGWFAPRNPVGLGALGLSGLSIASMLFIVVEMGEPFAGPMRVSPDPLKDALHAIESHPCPTPARPIAG